MIYSDDQNRRWWNGLAKSEQKEILDTMVEKMWNTALAEVFLKQWEAKVEFDALQLAAVRKWAS